MKKTHTVGHESTIPTQSKEFHEIATIGPIASGPSPSPYRGDFQHEKVITGPYSGEALSDGGKDRSIITNKGTGVSITESDGGEEVSLSHHSGAGVRIGPDGSIHVISTSKKGVGIGATSGDTTLFGTEVNIDSKGSVGIKTNGSLVLDVGQDLVMKVGGSIITQAGAKEEIIDKSAVTQIGTDQSVMVGGMDRKTIAGDSREQVTGDKMIDIGGDSSLRSDGSVSLSSKEDMSILSEGSSTYSSIDNMKLITDGDLETSAQDTIRMKSGTLTTYNEFTWLSVAGELRVDATGAAALKSGETVTLRGSETNIDGSTVNINTSTLNAPVHTGSGGSPSSGPSPSVSPPGDAEEVENAQVVEAETVIDEITSARVIPEYPKNAKRETGEMGAIGTVSHDYSAPAEKAYNMFSSKNSGTLSPIIEESGPEILTGNEFSDFNPKGNNIKSRPVELSPGSTYTSQKIDGVSVSELVNAPFSEAIPNSRKEEVLAAHAVVCKNIIAPLRAAGFNFFVTSAYRDGSGNHRTGYAVDMQVPGRIFDQHVAIAKFAIENLPCSQVFLERSGSGYTHVHLRAHPPGQSGDPTILTCGDPKCNSKESGLQVAWLRRRAKG